MDAAEVMGISGGQFAEDNPCVASKCTPGGIRTRDLRLRRRCSIHLSYGRNLRLLVSMDGLIIQRSCNSSVLEGPIVSLNRIDLATSSKRSYNLSTYGGNALSYGAAKAVPLRSLSGQIGVSQVVAGDQPKQRVTEQVRVLAVVEPEGELVKVCLQVLLGELVITADNSPVEQAPRTLDRVRVDSTANPLFAGVVNVLMLRVLVAAPAIGAERIRVDRLSIVRNDFAEESMNRVVAGIRGDLDAQLASALDSSEHGALVVEAMPCRFPLGVESTQLPADVGLVGFHDAREHRSAFTTHGGADTMAEVPSSLVRDTESALELVGADPLLGFANEVDGSEPLPERQVRVVEDRSRRDRELIAAIRALELVALLKARDLLGLAARAANAIRPAKLFQVVTAGILAIELLYQRYKVDFSVHGMTSHA